MQRVIGFHRQVLARQYKNLAVQTADRSPHQVECGEIEIEVPGNCRLIDNLALCRRYLCLAPRKTANKES